MTLPTAPNHLSPFTSQFSPITSHFSHKKSARSPNQPIQRDRSNDQPTHYHELIEGRNLKNVEPVADRADDEPANYHRGNSSSATEKASASDDGRSDGKGFKILAGARFSRSKASRG